MWSSMRERLKGLSREWAPEERDSGCSREQAPEAGRVQPGVGVGEERGAQVGAGARNREGRSWE
jgi:hypothetical protein